MDDSNRDIIVIGASMGGPGALAALARDLSPDLPAAVLVVQHQAAESPGALGRVLSRSGPGVRGSRRLLLDGVALLTRLVATLKYTPNLGAAWLTLREEEHKVILDYWVYHVQIIVNPSPA